jgi:CheY-like chemotaxis protein
MIGENIELVWKPRADAGMIWMDPSQLDQILANLCVNARDAINGTGRIVIETSVADVDDAWLQKNPDTTPGRYAVLAVTDTGAGIDPSVLPNLFEPFFTTKGPGEGTGLGLATVYGIVRQNGGFIDVYSEPGHGALFRVYLPRKTGSSTPPEPTASAGRTSGGDETILLVEDEPAILNMAKIMLERQGYRVLTASSSSEAICTAREFDGDIHLLVTDVIMTEMNGRELAAQLLGMHPAMRCLFMSGYTADVIAHHGVLDEGVHFVQKPFSSRELARKVREALESS